MDGFTTDLLDAISMATRAHTGQWRKDGRTPYVSHVLRVCLIVRQLFDIQDERILIAALLHDAIEDTTVDYDEIESRFGNHVADWVAALTKDKRLPEDRRESVYIETLKTSPSSVQLIKLADILDNYLDSLSLTASQRDAMICRARSYLEAFSNSRFDEVNRAYQLVSGIMAQQERSVGA